MNMGPYVFFLLAAVGLTAVIVESKIFRPIRDYAERWPWLHSLMTCYQCSGFWAGTVLYPFILGVNWGWVGAGFAASFLSVFSAALMNWIEANTVINLPPDPPSQPPAGGN